MRYGRISRLRAFAARVTGLFAPRKWDNDLDQELQAHLQLLVDRFVAQGMSREDAYILCSLAADLRVTQLVDDTKGVHMMLLKSMFR